MTYEPGSCVLAHRKDPEKPRRAVDGLYVCLGCRAKLARHLAQLPALRTVLEERLAGSGSTMAPYVTGTTDPGIELNDPVAVCRRAIRHMLADWARMVAEERDYVGPDDPDPSIVVPWLAKQHDWILAQRWVDEWAQDIEDLHSTAWSLAYPSGSRSVPVAPCSCGGTLTARVSTNDELLPEAVVCRCCGTEVPPRRWIALGMASATLTAVELAELWTIPVGTIQRWAHEDRWPRTDTRPVRYSAAAAQRTYDRLRPENQGDAA